jgi:hypothetical protein
MRGLPGAQVFYHLGELDEALNYALAAGTLFDVNELSEFVQTIVGECGEAAAGCTRPHVRLCTCGAAAGC